MSKKLIQDSQRHLCRFCGKALSHSVVDLGMSPLCNSFIPLDRLDEKEEFYPLDVKICDQCYLVQLDEHVSPLQIFSEYPYYSSFSESWLKHAADYVEMIIGSLELDTNSFVVEIASNDGYLLRNFVSKGIPCLGVEPAANIAEAAEREGVPSLVEFFNAESARKIAADSGKADLIIGNNVLAQVSNLNDFVEGIRILLKSGGIATLEFPHLHRLIQGCQYDTIYHEHFCYFSWIAVEQIFAAHGLKLFDVEELPTHGGSIRIYACHDNADRAVSQRAVDLRELELAVGYDKMETYAGFAEQVKKSKQALLTFLINARKQGKRVAAYGAPGKGNTLLNYCGIRQDFIEFTVDLNPYKLEKALPGTHIPVFPVEKIYEVRPDYLLILPWNIKEEIIEQMADIRDWGAKFVIPIPMTEIIE